MIWKLKRLVGLIFGNIECWRPFCPFRPSKFNRISDGPQNGVKTTATDIEEIGMQKETQFNSVKTPK